MLRGGLLALFLACPLWAYLRVPMETVQSRSAWACVRSAAGMGMDKHSHSWNADARTNLRCEQGPDTTKTSRAEQVGSYQHPDPEVYREILWQMKMDRQRQATTLEGCASQLHELQQRVDFLELYVDELRKHIAYELPISHEAPTLTPAQAQYLRELIQRPVPTPSTEEK